MSSHSRFPRRRLLRLAVPLLAALTACWLMGPSHAARDRSRSENVVLVLIDGLRWQEVFTGADETLMTKEAGGVAQPAELRKRYWRETAESRRRTLMPFLWDVVATQGQLYGNRAKGSAARVTNPHHFSYPGYSEMIVGFADPRIDSNAKKPNPNATVFEWLHRKPAFQGKVAAIGAWDVVPSIVNRERCGFPVFAGLEPITHGKISAEQSLLNRLKANGTQPWDWGPYDSVVSESALEFIKANRPRAMWITFGETDEWAHERRYDRYLDAAQFTDAYLRDLWQTLQSMGQYRGRTTLLVCVDHGRGRTVADWTSHSNKVPGADEIWMATLGPHTPALGERFSISPVTQSQMAATVPAAVSEDYHAAVPQSAPPLPDVVRH
ncbi:MAG: AP protein [Actinomycetota bacterium]